MKEKMGIALSILVICAACARFPELDASVSDHARDADFPNLVRSDILLSRRVEGRLSPTAGEELLARADRLRRRGEILRNIDVINDTSRNRFADTLRRLGG